MKKKILSILLSAAFGLGAVFAGYSANTMTTLAADGDPANATHSYEAYQIFTGKVDAGKLVEVKWGSAAQDGSAVQAKIIELVTPVDSTGATVAADKATAQDYARGIQAQFASTKELGVGADVLAAEINKVVTGKGLEITNGVIAGNTTGWYLIVDVTTGLTGDEAVYLDRAQLQMFVEDGTVTINEKRSEITIKKEVIDINDTVEVTYDDEDWGKTADYDFNDIIPFKITGTLPADYDTYSTFEYVFSDEQSLGLEFIASSVKVYKNDIADANLITEGYTVTEDVNKHSFKVTFANLKDVPVTKDDKIILSYNSKLTGEGVVYGFDGNPNKARIEFKNDKGGQGHTPWDIAIVFVFKPVVNKTDGTAALKGAHFSFSKKLAANDAAVDYGFSVLQSWEADDLSTFAIDGIDDGIYRIEETKAPDGYNGIDPIYFEVVAVHDDTTKELISLTVYNMVPTYGENKALTGLTRGEVLGTVDKTGASSGNWLMFTTEDHTRKTDKADNSGNINVEVINQQGVVLPSTGGIGTTIFYVIGGVLVVGAVVLLIVRRRMRNEEE